MKKTFKRAGVAVLSMAMLLSMGAVGAVSASAVDASKINVAASGKVTAASKVDVYLVAQYTGGQWVAANSFDFGTTSFADLSDESEDSATVKNLAVSLARQVSGKTKVITDGSVGSDLTLGAVDKGYYLIIVKSSDAGAVVQPILKQINAGEATAVSINAKSTDIPFDKKITATTAGNVDTTPDQNTSVGAVGSTVSYEITTKTPQYATTVTSAKDFVITDRPSAGIDVKNGQTTFAPASSNVVVTIGGETAYTGGIAQAGFTGVEVAAAGAGFEVTIPGAIVIANQNEDVKVTFDSKITSSANKGSTANPNDADLTYGNDFATGQGDGRATDEVKTYVGSVTFHKNGQDSQSDIAGAKFTLHKETAEGAAVGSQITTTAGNSFNFGYLEPGTYVLVEDEAPSKYKTAGNYTFTITADDNRDSVFDTYKATSTDTNTNVAMTPDTGDIVITVTDPVKDTLPGTGGMGTVLFTVGGAAIVLLAGALFVVYMRKRKNEE